MQKFLKENSIKRNLNIYNNSLHVARLFQDNYYRLKKKKTGTSTFPLKH